MYQPVYTKQFEKDTKRCIRRGKNFEKFKMIARTLLSGNRLDPIHRDHKLVGNFIGRRDCHIESDWILIYRFDGDRICSRNDGGARRDVQELDADDAIILVIIQNDPGSDLLRFDDSTLVQTKVKRISLSINFDSHGVSSADGRRTL